MSRIRPTSRKIKVALDAYRGILRLLTRQPLLGLTSRMEQSYFRHYARTEYTGAGEIVDLGSWLGSTTIPLAQGVRANPNLPPNPGCKIHAYDLFVWKPLMERAVAGTELEGRFRDGDSLVDEFKRRTQPWADLIRVNAGDLRQIGWNGDPIEFLLVDAMKSWKLAECICTQFYPCLIPNRAVVLHQDFAHCYTPWIHLLNYRLRDHLEFLHDVSHGGSTAFRYRSEFPRELLAQPYSFDAFSDDDIKRAFDLSMSLVAKRKQPNIAAAKVMLFIQTGDRERARHELNRLLSAGVPLKRELVDVSRMVAGPPALSPEL